MKEFDDEKDQLVEPEETEAINHRLQTDGYLNKIQDAYEVPHEEEPRKHFVLVCLYPWKTEKLDQSKALTFSFVTEKQAYAFMEAFECHLERPDDYAMHVEFVTKIREE
jgi:hypothetical protein